MKRIEYLILAGSLVATFLISTVFGFAGGAIIGTFWAWFWISFLIQVIVFAAWNSFLIQKNDAIAQQTEIQMLEQLSKFVIPLSCAYCKQSNSVPIQLNIKNTFKCEHCKQTNGVYMQFTATTLTTPVESVKLPLEGSDSVEFKVSR